MSRTLENDRLMRALRRETVDRTPVWIMRQAGRYLPEYRALRTRARDFLTLCKTPELACEATLQPIKRFPQLDAAIVFSDILTVPDAMGRGLYFAAGEGPRFERPVRTLRDVRTLHVPDPNDELGYVMSVIAAVRGELGDKLPLIGFAGSPWTVATYMVEGGPSKTHSHIRGMMYSDPDVLHELLEILAQASCIYLAAQIAAGADVVMVFDTWGGTLTPAAYKEFSLRYMEQIVAEIRDVPVVLFTKDGGAWLEAMADTGATALGLDWTTDIGDARRRVGDRVALQGNLDPCVLYAPPEQIRSAVANVLESFGPGNGHVFNLGHGIHPGIDPAHLEALLNAVHELSPAQH
ncbi:MAG: uroporphyrinogen decarboxylase [Gammaproteobacteria bacterium]|nr:uroporphyrinogen decarboxylase [Gammaproteobacteria bacterium]MDH3767871.1 uroporphyrinogen decarboxylase [Gammaproteobacteria bacterium]